MKVSFVAIAATILGGLGTWIDIGIARAHGYQGDGWFIAIPAGIALAMIGFQKNPKLGGIFTLMLFAGVITFWKIIDLTSVELFGENVGFAVMAWGLPLAAAGSVVALVSTVMAWRSPA